MWKLDNYRGICIGSTIGKIFTCIIGQRLYKLVENENWLGEIQGGFREDRATTDNIYIVNQIIEMTRKKKEKLYIAFIDLRKAFDRVWRKGMWKKLKALGIDGKFINIVKNLYQNTKKKVKTIHGYTEWVEYDIGVKQGCVLSPLLFSIYMMDMGKRLEELGIGYSIENEILPGIFFADDIVIMAKTKEELMKQIEVIEEYNKKWKLETNMEKSKILIIGGNDKGEMIIKIGEREIGKMEITNWAKYLGVKFGNKNSFKIHKTKNLEDVHRMVRDAKITAEETGEIELTMSVIWNTEIKS